MHTHAVLLGPLCHKGLVAVALLPTKVEIAMSDSETACSKTAYPQISQTHGVNTPTYRQKILMIRGGRHGCRKRATPLAAGGGAHEVGGVLSAPLTSTLVHRNRG